MDRLIGSCCKLDATHAKGRPYALATQDLGSETCTTMTMVYVGSDSRPLYRNYGEPTKNNGFGN